MAADVDKGVAMNMEWVTHSLLIYHSLLVGQMNNLYFMMVLSHWLKLSNGKGAGNEQQSDVEDYSDGISYMAAWVVECVVFLYNTGFFRFISRSYGRTFGAYCNGDRGCTSSVVRLHNWCLLPILLFPAFVLCKIKMMMMMNKKK